MDYYSSQFMQIACDEFEKRAKRAECLLNLTQPILYSLLVDTLGNPDEWPNDNPSVILFRKIESNNQ